MSASKGIQELMREAEASKHNKVSNQESGGSGGKKPKKSAAAVTPADDAENLVARLATGNDTTPASSSKDKETQKENQSNDEENEELSEEESEELELAFNYLMKLTDQGILTVQEAENLTTWAEEQLEDGYDVSWIARRLMSAKKRIQIFSLPRFAGKERLPQICLSYKRKSDRMKNNGSGTLQNETPNSEAAGIAPITASGEEQWSQFGDEYPMDQQLDAVFVEVWTATIEMNIKQAETILKELTVQFTSKKVSNCNQIIRLNDMSENQRPSSLSYYFVPIGGIWAPY